MDELSVYLSDAEARCYPEYIECAKKIYSSRSQAAKAPHRRTWHVNFRYEGGEIVGYLCVQDVGAVGKVGRYEVPLQKIPPKILKRARAKLTNPNKPRLCKECGKPL